MNYEILDKVNSVEDLKSLPSAKLEPLCDDIRRFLIDKVGITGGHLASNLGVTELTVAIHRVFDSPKDHVIFDVGHQSYIHKLITGRKDRFDTLRVPGGLSGFTLRRESAHDPFGAGHSSTSISAALGFAEADALSGSDAYTVCVIGDGAYTGGMAHEAINNCKPELPLIIILNENGMSISSNKGAFASYLSGVRSSIRYQGAKRGTTNFLEHIPLLGRPLKGLLSFGKNLIKRIIFKPNYFEQLGFYYIGPIDGNNYKKIEKALRTAKELKKCVILHVKTVKGKGLVEAEKHPDEFHSVGGQSLPSDTFHSVFADELISLASKDDKILAVTAAMGIGTGLDSFEKSYPDRYFDVGIAEEHALTFCAGLAASGYKPFVAIYSTFLQRGYDSIIHDIALQGLPVRMIIDRAGIARADGATHHGIFDVAFLSHIPGIEILSPATFGSLRECLRYASECNHPIAIRYPNSSESPSVVEHFYPDRDFGRLGTVTDYDAIPDNIIVSYGPAIARALEAKAELEKGGVKVGLALVERIRPFDGAVSLIKNALVAGARVLFVEEGIKNGGCGMIIRSILADKKTEGLHRFDICSIDDNFVSPESTCDIYDYAGISKKKIIEYFNKF